MFCAALAWVLLFTGFSIIPTLFFISLISTHYIINNTTLWNVFNGVTLGYFFCVAGFIVLLRFRQSAPAVCLALILWCLSIGAYQTNILLWPALWLIIALGFWIKDKPVPIVFFLKSMVIFAVCFVAYLAYIKIYTLYASDYDQRILAADAPLISALEFRFRKILDMQINLGFSALAFYLGETVSMRLWYMLPFLFAAGVFVSGLYFEKRTVKWLLISAVLLVLPLLAAAPLLGVSRPSITWRMSFPSLLAYCFTLFILFGNLYENCKKPAVKLMISAAGMVLIFVMIPVSHLEARSRLAAYQNDTALLAYDMSFWQTQALAHPPKGFVFARDITDYFGNTDIYSGYNGFTKRHTFGFSGLAHDFSWGGALTLRGYDLDSPEAHHRTGLLEKCLTQPDYTDDYSGWKISRELSSGTSYFCHE